MIKLWTDEAWADYLYWQSHNQRTLERIHQLISDTERNGNQEGIGKPEPLKYELQGYFSRRIDEVNRLVYVVDGAGLTIISCRYRYS